MEGTAQANTTHRSLLPSLQLSRKKKVRLFYSHTTYSLFTKFAKPTSVSNHEQHKPSAQLHNPYLYVFIQPQLTIL
jgi:hypothetical protein